MDSTVRAIRILTAHYQGRQILAVVEIVEKDDWRVAPGAPPVIVLEAEDESGPIEIGEILPIIGGLL